MLEKELQKIGLSDKEAIIYLTLLKYTDLTAGKIAKKTSLPRATVYSSLESLINKGLVSTSLVGRVKHFNSESMEMMDDMIQEEEQKIKNKKAILHDLKIYAKELKQEIEKPEVTFHEGKKSVESLFKFTATNNKHIYEIGDWRIFGSFAKKFIRERIRNNNRIELLTIASEESEKQQKDDKKLLRKQYFIKQGQAEVPALIAVGDDHLSIFTLDKKYPIGIKIRNKKIIKTMQTLFEIALGKIEKIEKGR